MGESQDRHLPGGIHLPRRLQLRKIPLDYSKQVFVQYGFWVDEAILRAQRKLHGEKILWIYASKLWVVEIAAYNFFPVISLLMFILSKEWVLS